VFFAEKRPWSYRGQAIPTNPRFHDERLVGFWRGYGMAVPASFDHIVAWSDHILDLLIEIHAI